MVERDHLVDLKGTGSAQGDPECGPVIASTFANLLSVACELARVSRNLVTGVPGHYTWKRRGGPEQPRT